MKWAQSAIKARSLSALLAGVGFIFVSYTKGPSVSGMSQNSTAAYLLGVLLLLVGTLGFLFAAEIQLVIHREYERVQILSRSFFGLSQNSIPFSIIAQVQIQRVGRTRGWPKFYFLVFVLKDGKRVKTNLWWLDSYEAHHEAETMSRIIGCSAPRNIESVI